MTNPSVPEEKESLFSLFFDVLEMFVIAVCSVFVIFMCFGRICRVEGDSMYQTLIDGQLLFTSNLAYTPQNGDIVILHQTSETDLRFNEPIVKRVIGVGGQFVRIDMEEGKVYVSDDEIIDESDVIDEPYIYLDGGRWIDHYGIDGKVFAVPEGHIFVLGDNRNVSADSRYSVVGFVDNRRVLGRVVCRLIPFSKFGKVE